MHDFTLGLALYDFVPVLFTAVAVLFIARMIQQHEPTRAPLAYTGAGLVIAAGLSKALWKLLVTTTGQDIGLLANALFPLMAPGFTLLAFSFWSAMCRRRGNATRHYITVMSLLAIFLVFLIAFIRSWGLEIERGWFMPIMTLASVTNLALTVMLMVAAWRQGRWPLALLFVVNVAMVFALQQIAQIEPMTIALHWLEQTLTAVGAGAFALASFWLYQALSTTLPEVEESVSFWPRTAMSSD